MKVKRILKKLGKQDCLKKKTDSSQRNTKIFDKKKISPKRRREIEEYARRNFELMMQGYEFEDTPEDIENLFRILSKEKDLFSIGRII